MKTLRRARIIVLLLLADVSCAQALDPHRQISQFGHTVWRVRDGDIPAPAYPITQTADGYLWVGTQAGLMRYDGVRFVPLTALTKDQLPSSFVTRLVAARDGSLWIGTPKSLSHWVNHRLINYPHGVGPMLEDRFGALWFTSSNPAVELPLCQVINASIRCYGKHDGIDFLDDRPNIGDLWQDGDGSFWVSTTNSVLRWKPGSKSVVFQADAKTKASSSVMVLAADPSGPLWVGIDARGTGLGLQQLVQGVIRAPVIPQLDPSTLAVQALFVDRANTLWVGTLDQGIFRIRADRVDHFRAVDGLSGDSVYWFYEDREGDLWVSTSGGIDRFRDLRIANFSVQEGLSVTETDSVLASRDGRIWIGGAEALDIFDSGHVVSLKTGQGLPGHQVTRLLEDRAGQIWIGLDNTLSIYRDGKFSRVDGLHGGPLGWVSGLVEDTDGNVWASVKGSPAQNKLVRIREDQVREEIPVARSGPLAADRAAGIWLLQPKEELLHYVNGQFEKFTFTLSYDRLRNVAVTPDGTVLVETDAGVVAFKNGQQRALTRANGLPCNDVYGAITDSQNALWLFAQCGLIEIPAEQLRQWWEQPGTQIQPRLLDVFDGVVPGRAPFNVAAQDPDGRLWFANGEGLVERLDPRDLLVRQPPLPVYIEEVVADRMAYAVQGRVRLPPNPRDVEIDYTALSLAIPQRVRFRYKLDRHDVSWQEPGKRRQAFYSDLPPGNYLFHVIAANSDGEWNTVGATLALTVAPAWYQEVWFRALCVFLGVVAIALLYRLRARQIARDLRARFDERLAERTRLARDLHDTFLQTIQGSKLVADNALDPDADPAGLPRAMEQLSAWLERATQESREVLNSLRSSTEQRNDLGDALQHAIEECRRHSPIEASFSVVGNAEEMHPIVRDEIYRISYEAIRNACTHSKGTRLEVGLNYSQDLNVRVRDNGVGIDPSVLDHGREGHFGLQGMRERAARIGSKLTVVSSPNAGTEVTLVVPGRIIYRKASAIAMEKIKGIFRRPHAVSDSK